MIESIVSLKKMAKIPIERQTRCRLGGERY